MAGTLALLVALFFLWKFNTAMERDESFLAGFWICLGFGVVFLMGNIFL